ncbi:SAV_6107 family HEPN domain-containing protein [Cellulomonas xiejunii]|uniref:SAV_6107 family HEPN domain-containing protein n=1 Tax=Cellulomonas xiejunii TaxID=2968083 RepID=A0ABY5KSX4_9CELL|nr:SAV_6107 family HEPN domain-containing protein [Cellulomonas xiejunii]MCC2316009.1 colicin transporter [Cellulomonas xiejunii]MCC2322042.1 colicin transporter [Cellulomonas xiejunii]UUI73334.1 SAV_6107 family HEPN domain-containing protein [Cellulomonas xiejunii]
MSGRLSALHPSTALPQSAELLSRADAELLAAQFSGEPWEMFSHAHLAALRAGAALVEARGRPAGRGAPRTVWGMLDAVAPELHTFSALFAQAATLRSAVDAGRFELVTPARAERALCAAEDLVDAVRDALAAQDEARVLPSAVAGR